MSPRSNEKLITPEVNKHRMEQVRTLRNLRSRAESLPKIRSFAEAREKLGSHAEAFSALSDYLSKPENASKYGFNESERNFMKVASLLGTFVDASLEKSYTTYKYGDEQPNKETREHLRSLTSDYLIPFNHALKEFINENPDLNIDLTSSLLLDIYAEHYDDKNMVSGKSRDKITIRDLNEAEYQISSALRGMRAEMAVETILSAAGVEYNFETTVEDDHKGADLLVMIDGKLEKIDIKSSLTGQMKAHEKWNGSRAVGVDLKESDYSGQKGLLENCLTLPFSKAKEVAPEFVERMKEIISYAKKVEKAKKIGSKVLSSNSQ